MRIAQSIIQFWKLTLNNVGLPMAEISQGQPWKIMSEENIFLLQLPVKIFAETKLVRKLFAKRSAVHAQKPKNRVQMIVNKKAKGKPVRFIRLWPIEFNY